jgi:hypothetical protein
MFEWTDLPDTDDTFTDAGPVFQLYGTFHGR